MSEKLKRIFVYLTITAIIYIYMYVSYDTNLVFVLFQIKQTSHFNVE